MKKEYRHTGDMPIVVEGFGRVNPKTRSFICEMDPGQERFFLQIGAIAILRSAVPDSEPTSDPSKPEGASAAYWPGETVPEKFLEDPPDPDEAETVEAPRPTRNGARNGAKKQF